MTFARGLVNKVIANIPLGQALVLAVSFTTLLIGYLLGDLIWPSIAVSRNNVRLIF
jgi:hypothetical protein